MLRWLMGDRDCGGDISCCRRGVTVTSGIPELRPRPAPQSPRGLGRRRLRRASTEGRGAAEAAAWRAQLEEQAADLREQLASSQRDASEAARERQALQACPPAVPLRDVLLPASARPVRAGPAGAGTGQGARGGGIQGGAAELLAAGVAAGAALWLTQGPDRMLRARQVAGQRQTPASGTRLPGGLLDPCACAGLARHAGAGRCIWGPPGRAVRSAGTHEALAAYTRQAVLLAARLLTSVCTAQEPLPSNYFGDIFAEPAFVDYLSSVVAMQG